MPHLAFYQPRRRVNFVNLEVTSSQFDYLPSRSLTPSPTWTFSINDVNDVNPYAYVISMRPMGMGMNECPFILHARPLCTHPHT